MGVTHMWGGKAYELCPHHEWVRNAEMFSILKKRSVLFSKGTLLLVGGGRGCSLVGFKGACFLPLGPCSLQDSI